MDNELMHYGVLGMKWGVRRFQNKDGTLTKAGKRKYDKEMDKLKKEERILKNKKRTQAKIDKLDAKRKELEELRGETSTKKTKKSEKTYESYKELSNDELSARIARMKLEDDYKVYMDKRVEKGKKLTSRILISVVTPATEEIGRQVVKSILTKSINKFIKDQELKIATNNKKK